MEPPKSWLKFQRIYSRRFHFPWCTAQQKQRKKNPVLLWLLKKRRFSQHQTPVTDKEGKTEKKESSCLVRFTWGHHLLGYGDLLQKNRRGRKRLLEPLGCSYFLEIHCLLCRNIASSEWKMEHALLRLSRPHLPAVGRALIWHSPVSAEFPGTWILQEPLLMVHLKRLYADLGYSALCLLPTLQCPAGCIKHKFREKF